MDDKIRTVIIPNLTAKLTEAGIAGQSEYQKRLTGAISKIENFKDLLLEADAALMFSHNGFRVTMRESPDLRIDLGSETAYAEVKHFRTKEQDLRDRKKIKNSEDLVTVGILRPDQRDPWDQIADRAAKYSNQYVQNAPNILVFISDSDAVHGLVLGTAVHQYNKLALASPENSPLRRLSAMMLVDEVTEIWTGQDLVNVYYCPTALDFPVSPSMTAALTIIRRWSWPRDVVQVA